MRRGVLPWITYKLVQSLYNSVVRHVTNAVKSWGIAVDNIQITYKLVQSLYNLVVRHNVTSADSAVELISSGTMMKPTTLKVDSQHASTFQPINTNQFPLDQPSKPMNTKLCIDWLSTAQPPRLRRSHSKAPSIVAVVPYQHEVARVLFMNS
ncbi:hypothetical protein J6590_097340 [Homalodisca vitripennis]|nr:hypothetical protein J6590_097340 [Homalodisca vitripennis]